MPGRDPEIISRMEGNTASDRATAARRCGMRCRPADERHTRSRAATGSRVGRCCASRVQRRCTNHDCYRVRHSGGRDEGRDKGAALLRLTDSLDSNKWLVFSAYRNRQPLGPKQAARDRHQWRARNSFPAWVLQPGPIVRRRQVSARSSRQAMPAWLRRLPTIASRAWHRREPRWTFPG